MVQSFSYARKRHSRNILNNIVLIIIVLHTLKIAEGKSFVK